MNSELTRKIRDILEQTIGACEGDPCMGNPPEWDAASHVNILTALEEEFCVRFDARQIATMTDLGAIVRAVRELQQPVR